MGALSFSRACLSSSWFSHLACCLFLPPRYTFLVLGMCISLLMFTNACNSAWHAVSAQYVLNK